MIRSRSRILLLGMALSAVVPAAASEAAPRHVEIAAGPMDDALKRLALQARLQLLYEPDVVSGRSARALRGEYSPRDALRQLLAGSGLRAAPAGEGIFVIERTPVHRHPALPAPVARPPAPPDAVELGAVYVTGSHLRRADGESVSVAPVTVIDHHQIESSGYQTLFELLRFQPGMTGHHPVDVSADGGPGFQQPSAAAATTSLDVLGPRATLFLIDGRRIANYGLVSSDLGGLTDLDGIPLSIVERVEILRGGASAIYGADAMAGVVNIVLKPAGAGSEVSVNAGLSSRGDAAQQRVSFSLGRDAARGGGMSISGELFHRDALQGASRGWRTSDRRGDGLGDWRYAMGYRAADGALVQPFCAADAASDGPGCRFDPPRQTSLLPSTDRVALLWRWRQPLGEGLEWQADVRVGRLEQRLRSAPFHANITLPPGYAGAPAGADSIDYAFDDIGPILSRNRTDSHDIVAGLTGLVDGGWQWRLRLSNQRNRVTSRVRGLVRESAVLDALDDGSYRFGVAAIPSAVMAAISPRVVSRGATELDQALFDADGGWFALPGGDARLALGAEVQRDALDNRPDPLMVEHDLALGMQRLPLHADRSGASAYAELSLPWSAHWRSEAALRTDWRQGYGHRASPSLGLVWTPTAALAFRAHWATGYRAPSLFELRRPNVMDGLALIRQSDRTGACRYAVPVAGMPYCLVTHGAIENPHLRAETSRSLTLGLVWSPVPASDIALDHFRIVRRNEIQTVDVTQARHLIPEALVRDAGGRLIGIRDYFDNAGLTDVRGWNLDARYTHETSRSGRLVWRLSGTYFRHVLHRSTSGEPLLDQAGHGAPDHVVLSSLEWTRGQWQATLGLRRNGPARVADAGEPCPAINLDAGHCTTPGSTIVNLDLAHALPGGWRAGLNIDNLLNRSPVDYAADKGGYDIAHDDPRGRYFGLTIGKTFP
jgi:outer membrane receptor protein involved in Fe transport